jgi:hypothetical protein
MSPPSGVCPLFNTYEYRSGNSSVAGYCVSVPGTEIGAADMRVSVYSCAVRVAQSAVSGSGAISGGVPSGTEPGRTCEAYMPRRHLPFVGQKRQRSNWGGDEIDTQRHARRCNETIYGSVGNANTLHRRSNVIKRQLPLALLSY